MRCGHYSRAVLMISRNKVQTHKVGIDSFISGHFFSILRNITHENEITWSQWGQGTSSGSATVQRLMITYQIYNVRFLLDSDQEKYG